MKEITILKECVKCGICTQMTTKLKEKPDGSVEVIGKGLVSDSEISTFNKILESCPVNAILLSDSKDVGEDLDSLKKSLISNLNKFKSLSIDSSEYRFDSSKYTINIPGRSPKENGYPYRDYSRAESEGLQEFDRMMYSQKRQIIQRLLVDYKVNVLNKFIDYSEDKNNFYFKINNQISNLLKEFAQTVNSITNGKINLDSSFTDFKVIPSFGIKESHNDLDSHTYVYHLRHIEEVHFVDSIINELEPLRWFDTYVDVDDKEDSRGRDKYGYRLNGTYKTLAKQILSEASYILNDNCSDGVGPTINEQLKRYQEVLNAAIDEKINQINKL